ncbi:MAG: 30S ribosomal protein S2, partial [Bdellovibrionaceae bacterium]|nr:30S ribosomal protein S2 [Pseudobdellovibrionaceae bacterium]
ARSEAPKKIEPTVVKVQKVRKLVAAGTAEDVEIQAELETQEATPTEEPAE